MDPLELINKYYTPDSELHYVLVKHSEQVRDKALDVARQHPELKLDLAFLAEAAMLHDIGIFRCNAPRIFCHGPFEYIQHGYLGAEILHSEGFPRHALVCERHTGTGISLKKIIEHKLPLPHRDMLPISMEEQVICYADKFFSKTELHKIHSLERIRTQLNHFGEENVRIFDAWHGMFRSI
jgi:uncharacterized protein